MKKFIALIGVSLLFSGASFDNKANNIPVPYIRQDEGTKIIKLDSKVHELDSLVTELNNYEKNNK